MFKLIRAERCFLPEETDAQEILVVAGQIAAVGRELASLVPEHLGVEIIEGGPGSTAVPGLIDNHVHITGGGGEGGYHTRVPEIMLTDITTCGVTSLIGVLGTDDVTRHLESLLAKARGLENEGLSTYILSGSYSLPTPTLTGSIKRDIVLIDKVLGAGEIAISDHRASKAGFQALRDAAAGCRLGGLLSGKAGVLQIHVGEDPEGLAPLRQLVSQRDIPIGQIVPTHLNRTSRLFGEAIDYLKFGGNIDLTAFDFPSKKALTAAQAVAELKNQGVDFRRVTLSSDSNGSLPEVDEQGRVVGLRQAKMKVLLQELRSILSEEILSWAEVLPLVTSNVARIYGLKGKGGLYPGYDADITVFDADLGVKDVVARGRVMVRDGQPLVKGTFQE